MKRFVLGVVCCLSIAGSLRAQEMAEPTTKPADSPEAVEVKAATKTFLLALAEKDIAAAQKLFAGSPEDAKMMESMHKIVRTSMHVKEAATAKWPEEMKTEAGDELDIKVMIEKIDKETVTIDGDSASFEDGPKLKKIDGKWKMIDVIGDPMAKQVIGKMASKFAELVEGVAVEIEQGKYKSMAEAKASLEAKVQAAVGAMMQQQMEAPDGPEMPATPPMPTTMPAMPQD